MFRKLLIFAGLFVYAAPVSASDHIPVWPGPGDEADVTSLENCEIPGRGGAPITNPTGIRVVSKIGNDLVVENDFSGLMGGNRAAGGANGGVVFAGGDWYSGGANLVHGKNAPMEFYDYSDASMPLLQRNMMEDDGSSVLAATMPPPRRRNDEYVVTAANGWTIAQTVTINESAGESVVIGTPGDAAIVAIPEIELDEFPAVAKPARPVADGGAMTAAVKEGAKSQKAEGDVWVVPAGQTLRSVLKDWCARSGWDLVWNTAREYPIEASAIFRGKFEDSASALVRNFSRATPSPLARFYKGNKVLVITTNDGE